MWGNDVKALDLGIFSWYASRLPWALAWLIKATFSPLRHLLRCGANHNLWATNFKRAEPLHSLS